MEITERQFGEVTVLAIRGDFDAYSLPQGQQKLSELIKKMQVRLVVNLRDLEIVTSTAVGFLADAARRTRRLGGEVLVTEVSRLFLRVVDTLQFGSCITVFDTDRDALAHFERLAEAREADKVVADPPPRRRRFRFWPMAPV